jgi:hypothetical protein
MGIKEFGRTPILLALLVVLPAYYIGAMMYIVPTTKLPVTIAGERTTVGLTELIGVLMTPLTAGLLAGIVGLFVMQSSKAADDRLRLAGYRSRDLIVSRVSLLAAGGIVVSTLSLVVVLVGFVPTSIPAFVAATVLTALTYGVFGVIVGVSLDRLSGVYVMLFAPYVDLLLFQNPLSTEPSTWATVLPGHFAMEAVLDAAFVTGVDISTFAWAIGYLAVALLICIMVFHHVTQVE